MPIFIGNGSIDSASGNSFIMRSNTGAILYQQSLQTVSGTTFGISGADNTPAFYAIGYNNSTPVNLSNGNWYKLVNVTQIHINRGSHYNPSETRFTAPKAGYYLFVSSTWFSFSTQGWYTHPQNYINGSLTAGRGTSWKVRIKGHGFYPDSYDTLNHEILYLSAGDYVEPWIYSGGNISYLPYHTIFSGYFLG